MLGLERVGGKGLGLSGSGYGKPDWAGRMSSLVQLFERILNKPNNTGNKEVSK